MKLDVAAHIASLVPYPPGKPIEELEREYGISGSIKLASNENPLGPSPRAVAAIREHLDNLHRYPDGSCYYLARELAAHLGVEPGELVFGNGSNEIIGLLVAAFVSPGQEVISSHPSFLVYQKVVQAHGGVNRVVPLAGMDHDLEGILAAITPATRLIFLDNPNNPTGRVFDGRTFESFLARLPGQVIVALDEAYLDFVEPDQQLDARRYLRHAPPVVALRTFSKAYGLAGLRIGYGLMAEEVAGYLHRVRQPFNVNQLAQVAARAAITDAAHYARTLELTRTGMAWLHQQLTELGCIPFASQTNFFLLDIKGDGKTLYARLLREGVIIRPMNAYGFPHLIRVTVGLPEENQRLVASLAHCLEELGYGRWSSADRHH